MSVAVITPEIGRRLARARLLLMDVDGVLTDGGVTWNNSGIEQKTFHIRDGLGIRLWCRAGCTAGIVTGRSSHVVELRARELGIAVVRQGVAEKWPVVAEVLALSGVGWDETIYIGDDLPDLAVIRDCGVGVAVADAAPEVREAAAIVTRAPGGRGAVREIVEMALTARGAWEGIVRRFASARTADPGGGRS
jgi:3-deoxy-D-manno-octulosonate 8-phosphate phosphatase (KDO 8-P phosphatase)